jgi:hypothetical protein
MPLYRFYTIGEDGHIVGMPAAIECPDDDAAVEEAKRRIHAHAIEIWDLARRVARVDLQWPTSKVTKSEG